MNIMDPRVTKRKNRHHKAASRQMNLAARRDANQGRANSKAKPCWSGIIGPPAPHTGRGNSEEDYRAALSGTTKGRAKLGM